MAEETITDNVRKALRRPLNYATLSFRRQWDVDAGLGLLDWEPTPGERTAYLRLRKEAGLGTCAHLRLKKET